jgi:hypothetical protein
VTQITNTQILILGLDIDVQENSLRVVDESVDSLHGRAGSVPLYKPNVAAFVDLHAAIFNYRLLFVGESSNASIEPMTRLTCCQEDLADNRPAIVYFMSFPRRV